jgi:Cu/Ag efflux protein CusF
MPIKLKPSYKKYDRQTKKTTLEHYYIKNISKDELF